jgi:hypothetical protein
MSKLYHTDILLRSEYQAELLRHRVSGEPVNERPGRANIIEEVENSAPSTCSATLDELLGV